MGKASDKLWELESRIPEKAKKVTDPIIKRALRFRGESQTRGKKWAEEQRRKLRI